MHLTSILYLDIRNNKKKEIRITQIINIKTANCKLNNSQIIKIKTSALYFASEINNTRLILTYKNSRCLFAQQKTEAKVLWNQKVLIPSNDL